MLKLPPHIDQPFLLICFLSGHPAVSGNLKVRTVQTICFFLYWKDFSLYICWAWRSPPGLEDDLNVSKWSGLCYHHVILDQKFSILVFMLLILSCVPCFVQCWGLTEISLYHQVLSMAWLAPLQFSLALYGSPHILCCLSRINLNSLQWRAVPLNFMEKKVPWHASPMYPSHGVVVIHALQEKRKLFPASYQHKPAVQQV